MYDTGTFIAGQTLIYKLDPRVKLAFTVTLSIFILWASPLPIFSLGVILLLTALTNGITLRTVGQSVKPLLLFIILIFLAHALFASEVEGALFVSYLGISLGGIQGGFIAVWRFLCLIVAAVLLTMTTAPSRLVAAIKYFLHPLKFLRVPVDDIAVMITLALRMMPALLLQKKKIERAQIARGGGLRRFGLWVRAKYFLSLVLGVLLGTFRRADELALAMEARAYARGERTSAVELKIRRVDYLAILLFCLMIIIFMALNLFLS